LVNGRVQLHPAIFFICLVYEKPTTLIGRCGGFCCQLLRAAGVYVVRLSAGAQSQAVKPVVQ
jgi:hypothetical protein